MAVRSPSKRAWLGALPILALVGPLSPPASAGKLVSAPVGLAGGSLVECSIVNVSEAPAKVAIRIIDQDAVLLSTAPATLAPGASTGASAFCHGACVRPYCKFVTGTGRATSAPRPAWPSTPAPSPTRSAYPRGEPPLTRPAPAASLPHPRAR